MSIPLTEIKALVELSDIDGLLERIEQETKAQNLAGYRQAENAFHRKEKAIDYFWTGVGQTAGTFGWWIFGLGVCLFIGSGIYFGASANMRQGAYERGACSRGDVVACQQAIQGASVDRESLYRTAFKHGTGRDLPAMMAPERKWNR